jgi:hypothetical protein
MEQLRFSLIQAREYFQAAENASAATKPLQLYYCCMCLALSEILWNGDGNHSLDKLRLTHRHHGLILSPPPNTELDLRKFSSQLIARPMLVKGVRLGTFEVWHGLSRQTPLVGKHITQHGTGTLTGTSILYASEDTPLEPVPTSGISLYECLVRIPGLIRPLHDFKIQSALLRATLQRVRVRSDDVTEKITDTINVQPNDAERIHHLRNRFLFDPNDISNITSFDFPSGFHVSWFYDPRLGTYSCHLPEGFSYKENEVYFLDDTDYLNEFGFLYIALYLLGMFARYFPDLWIREVESNSEFAIVVEYLLDYARWRLPVLLLGNLTRTVFVLKE